MSTSTPVPSLRPGHVPGLYQFVIICEPEGLRIQLRTDRNPNQDLGILFTPTAIEQVQR